MNGLGGKLLVHDRKLEIWELVYSIYTVIFHGSFFS